MTTFKMDTYLNEEKMPYPFCPGCGHHTILDSLNEALVKLQLDPQEVVIVTDIGCTGLSDKYFVTNAFHGLHGRSVTYATGIKMARPELTVIVLIGDGGCGIGGHHLLNAARRNIGVNVFVFNNFNYGMTGGEHSITSPLDSVTTTTRYGHIERPLDLCATADISGANFVARASSFDKDLPDIVAKVIQHEGFSLLDIWELCTAYYVPNNRFGRKDIEATLESLNLEKGVLKADDRPEFSHLYRERVVGGEDEKKVTPPTKLKPRYENSLGRQMSFLIAGAAGTKIGSAGTLFSQGGILAGLHATQRNDYPVTIKTRHSIAEVILSREEIYFTGVEKPDVMFVLFPEGLNKSRDRIARLTEDDLLVINANLPKVETKAKTWALDFKPIRRWGRKKEYWALMAIAAYLREYGTYPLDALIEAINLKPQYAKDNLAAVEASVELG